MWVPHFSPEWAALTSFSTVVHLNVEQALLEKNGGNFNLKRIESDKKKL
jgi:hypothetical protein